MKGNNMSVYTISRPVAGRPTPSSDNRTAAEFLHYIDAILADSRVASVIFDVYEGEIVDPGVMFVNQPENLYTSFVYPERVIDLDDHRHIRSDLYKINPGFGWASDQTAPTVVKRKRSGGTFEEFVPGSRTFISAHGWNLRPIHDALRAFDLKAASRAFSEVVRENFGYNGIVEATRSGFAVS